jgi:uncharacterized protein YacL
MYIAKTLFLVLTTVFGFSLGTEILEASAQTISNPGSVSISSKDQVKTIVIALFVFIVFLYFLFCAVVVLFSQDKEKIEFGKEGMRTTTAFFFGGITGWLG